MHFHLISDHPCCQICVTDFDENVQNCRSIGLFCHNDEPGELKLAHGCSVNLVSLADPDDDQPRNFFEALANHILPVEMGGQFDIFVPLAASGKI